MSSALEALTDALGPDINAALADPDTQDVIAKATGLVLIRKHGKITEMGHMDEKRRLAVLHFAAHFAGRCIRPDRASLSAVLPGSKARLKGHIPPQVKAASFTIRRPAPQLFDLPSYLDAGVMTGTQVRFLSETAGKKTLLIAGPVGGGKSTLMNAVLALPGYRELNMVTIEDDEELVVPPWTERLFTNLEGDPPATMQKCIEDALRMMAQAICIGEVRDGAAASLIGAWNTGMKGVCTVHADTVQDVAQRIEELCGLNPGRAPSRSEIYRAVNVVAFIQQRDDGTRRVEELVSVEKDTSGGWDLRRVA